MVMTRMHHTALQCGFDGFGVIKSQDGRDRPTTELKERDQVPRHSRPRIKVSQGMNHIQPRRKRALPVLD